MFCTNLGSKVNSLKDVLTYHLILVEVGTGSNRFDPTNKYILFDYAKEIS